MLYWGLSDTGLFRKENQDSYGIFEHDHHIIGIVCDGMGGTFGGAIASKLAIEDFQKKFKERALQGMTPIQYEQVMMLSITYANKEIRQYAANHQECANMGTTFVCALCGENNEDVVVCNVGDSRAYLINATNIVQVSKDHSVVENLVDRGELTQEQARNHPSKNLITRALGPDPTVLADAFLVHWKRGDSILLCSDGLVNTVTDQEIYEQIVQDPGDGSSLEKLLAISINNGAPDNVSMVLIKNEERR